MRDVWSCIADVAVHLPHNTYMLIAVEERILLLSVEASAVDTSLNSLVRFKASI